MMKTVVIGIGQFGNNHVRVLKELGHEVITCDIDKKLNPDFQDYKKIDLNKLEAVVIATPASTHYQITKYFLENKIPVLVEKPITLSYEHAKELVEISKKNKIVFQAGHIFRYNPLTERLIIELKRVLKENQKILAIRSRRIGMHYPRIDCSVIWDYAIHDLDMINYILNNCTNINLQSNNFSDIEISSAVLLGNPPIEDIATITYFIYKIATCYYHYDINSINDGIYAQIDVDWISPIKNRTLTLICENETLEADFIKEELRIYKSGMFPISNEEGEARFNIRMGDLIIPKISHAEPLKKELSDFVNCIKTGNIPISNAESCLLAYEMLDRKLRRK